MKKLFSILIIVLFASCQYSFFVNKKYIVKESRGYLVTREGEAIFYPFNDTVDTRFLADKTKKTGYRVNADTYWLDSLATDYSSLLYVKNDNKLSIVPVVVRYYPGDTWQKQDETSTVNYKWENETHELLYKLHDWRRIIDIYPARQSDRKRAAGLNIDWPPLHYKH